MSKPDTSKRTVIRWTTLKGLGTLLLFLLVAALAEYLVVLYAVSLGLEDVTLLEWSFKFPGTDWNVTLGISPLFHLVPIAVIATLLSSWMYLSKHVVVRSREIQKGKSGSSKIKALADLGRRIRLTRASVRNGLTVLVTFLLFILAVSLLAYPRLIYQTVTSAYQNNPSLLDFIRGTGEAMASIGSVFSPVNNALLASSPGFRDFAQTLGSLTKPLAGLDNAGKYLVFQNAAAWISAFLVLIYGEYRRKSHRYRKK